MKPTPAVTVARAFSALLTAGLLPRIVKIIFQQGPYPLANELKRKTLPQQMIEEFLRVGSRLRFAAQANPFRNRALNHFCFRSSCENLVERRVRSLLIDLFQPEVTLQSLPADGPLLHAQGGKAMRKLCVVEIAVFTQTLDHCFNCRFGCAAAFEQSFPYLFDRARLGGEQLARALKDALASFCRIKS